MNGTNLSGAALVERGRANAAWVRANLQSIKAMAGPPPETFGEKLTKAVKTVAGRRPRSTFVATATGEESFADKVKEAIARRTGGTVKQKAERAEKERARYRKPVRRPRSRSD